MSDVEHFFDFEHDEEPEDVRALALKLAIARGGQTCPVSDYDVIRAREQITGEVKEIDRLRRENAELRRALPAPESDKTVPMPKLQRI